MYATPARRKLSLVATSGIVMHNRAARQQQINHADPNPNPNPNPNVNNLGSCLSYEPRGIASV